MPSSRRTARRAASFGNAPEVARAPNQRLDWQTSPGGSRSLRESRPRPPGASARLRATELVHELEEPLKRFSIRMLFNRGSPPKHQRPAELPPQPVTARLVFGTPAEGMPRVKSQRARSLWLPRAPSAPGALSARPPPASLRSPHSLRASVMNRAATAASTAEARTVKPAVRNTVCKVVDETRIAPRPDPAARAI
jgi:hypothetical protein